MKEAVTITNLTDGVLQLNVIGVPMVALAKGEKKVFETRGEFSQYEKQVLDLVAAGWLSMSSDEDAPAKEEAPVEERKGKRGRKEEDKE